MIEAKNDTPALPNWGRVRLVLSGLALTGWAYLAVQFSHQPNTAAQLWVERVSPFYSTMYAPLWLGMGLCFVILAYLARCEQSPHWLILLVHWRSLSYRARALTLALLALLLLTFRLSQPITLEVMYEDKPNQILAEDKYRQINYNLQSIEQGCFLCVYVEDRAIALEVLSYGDDIGASMLYAALIRLSGMNPSIEHYIWSVRILVLAILILISLRLVFVTGQLWVGFIFFSTLILFEGLFIYRSLFLTFHWASVLTSWITVLLLIDWSFAPSEKQFLNQRAFVLIFSAYGAVAFILFSVRSSNGVVHWLFVVALLLLSAFQRRQWLRPALALTSFGVAYFAMSSLFHFALVWRNNTYNPETHGIVSHPFSHALYLGLGVVTNEYGIYWKDRVGDVPCPMFSVSGYTHEYYDCIRQAFVNLVIRDPGLVLRSLLMKLEALLRNSLQFNPLFVALPLALFLIKSLRFWLFFGFLLVLMSLPALLVMSFHWYMTGYLSLFTLLFAICILKLPDYIYAQD